MKYSQHDLVGMVEELRAYPAEPSWLEFKTGLKDPVQIAKYISGLSNVAAYAGSEYGYLVWGIQNETHEIVGTDFDADAVLAEARRIIAKYGIADWDSLKETEDWPAWLEQSPYADDPHMDF